MTMSRIFLVLGVLLIIVGGVAVYSSHKAQAPSEPVIKEPVPEAVDPSWETYSDDFVSFRYPAQIPTTYIHSVDWPPKVAVSEGIPTCAEPFVINEYKYCVTTTGEGAAGSTYIDYAYAREKDGKTLTLSFTLREVQCANYDDPQKTACEQERERFSPDDLADHILQTVVVK
jgi:hypothetical protein